MARASAGPARSPRSTTASSSPAPGAPSWSARATRADVVAAATDRWTGDGGRSTLGRTPAPEAVAAPSPRLLWALALAGCVAATAAFALAYTSDDLSEPGLQAALLDWVIVPFIAGGLIAWWRRPDTRFGPLMVAAGFATFVSSLQWASAELPYTVGLAFDLLPAPLLIHVFLAFPSGRLERRADRVVVTAAYGVAVGLQAIKMALGGVTGDNLLAVADEPAAANTVQEIQLFVLSALALTAVAILAHRRRDAGRPRRRAVALLLDSFALALVMLAALLTAGALDSPAFETLRRVTFGIVGIAPVVFLIGLLDARLARSAVGDLVVELDPGLGPAELRDALARALRDPSLTLAYWLPEFGSWAGPDGRRIDVPARDDGRATTLIDRDGARLAALLHDPSLTDEPELLDAVRAAAGIALENGRLHAELRARLEELKGSRERIVRAGQDERRRLERNLHDGAQQRLVALSLELGLLGERLRADEDARVRLEGAKNEVAMSLAELRDVARGLHPAVVSGHGLAVGLESLAACAPVPVRLALELDGRMDERIEVAAYYVVSESLANVGKHAHAGAATVAVARVDGTLVVEVADDGVGGADSERGGGLRGLADRVEALGGRLRVWTPRGGGTRVRAEIPCA
jgi:signal transduction histidine kinase